MQVCNSIDTICLTMQLSEITIAYMFELEGSPHKLPQWLCVKEIGVQRYAHGFESDGISIYFSISDKMKPNGYIRFSSEVIQRQGYDAVYNRLCQIMHFFGEERPGKRLQLSQIDLSFDFQRNFGEYINNRDDYHITTKLRAFRSYGHDDYATWKLWGGKNGYKVRCYDKLGEVQEKPEKRYWLQIWEQQGFDTEAPIWRVEYELRRDFLKKWKVNRFYDFFRVQFGIQGLLFSQWNVKNRDDSNVTRMSLVPEFLFLLEHYTKDFIKHHVDCRPEELGARAENAMQQALSAYARFIVHYCAYQHAKEYGMSTAPFHFDDWYALSEAGTEFDANIKSSVVHDDLLRHKEVLRVLAKRGYYYDLAA